MQEATRNQLSNVSNPFQGKAKKVLCVCSAGLLRSPTLANVLHKELGYNTRAVGVAKEYALIPITEALVAWADEIVFVDSECKVYLSREDWELIEEWGVKVLILDIPDEYNWNEEDLQSLCLSEYTGRN